MNGQPMNERVYYTVLRPYSVPDSYAIYRDTGLPPEEWVAASLAKKLLGKSAWARNVAVDRWGGGGGEPIYRATLRRGDSEGVFVEFTIDWPVQRWPDGTLKHNGEAR